MERNKGRVERKEGKGNLLNAARGMILGIAMLSAAGARGATIILDWDAVTTNADASPITDLAGYRVFYATYSLMGMTTTQAMGTASVTKVTVGNALTQTINNLQDGTSYYIRLTARDISGNNSDFNVNNVGMDVEVSTYTPPPAPPTAPGTPALTVLSDTQIRVTWTDAGGETSYRIERSPDNITYSTITTPALAANTTTYTNSGLTGSTQYHYRIVAKNAAGETVSGASNATTQAPPASAPGTPGSASSGGITNTQITINWTNVSAEDGYNIEWSLSPTYGTLQGSANVGMDVTTYQIGGLAAGTTYYYRVWAYNSAGNSGYTNGSAQTSGGAGPSGLPITLPAGLKEAYSYPNPAEGGTDPKIRAFMGGVDSVEVTIYDQAGKVIHSGRTTNTVTVNGETAHEYAWTGEKASGIYYAVIHGKKGNEVIRARAKIAVVR